MSDSLVSVIRKTKGESVNKYYPVYPKYFTSLLAILRKLEKIRNVNYPKRHLRGVCEDVDTWIVSTIDDFINQFNDHIRPIKYADDYDKIITK